MGWGKIGAVCSLKAIALACFLTPVATILPPTPAYAQFQIIIPGFGNYGYRGRRYGRRSARHARRGRGGQQQPGEVSSAPSGASTGGTSVAAPSGSGGKKIRGTAD